MKRILLSIIMLIVIFNINANENKKTIPFEFSIGGGIKHGVLYDSIYVKSTTNTFIIDGDSYGISSDESFIIGVPNQTVYMSLPISCLFFLNNKFGIGFINIFQIGLFFHAGFYLNSLLFNVSTLLLNKIGNIDKNKYLYIEYGLTLFNRFEGLFYYHHNTTFTNNVFFGPTINIGYDRYYKNNFGYSIGGFLNFLFRFEKFSPNATFDKPSTDITELLFSYFEGGVQIRFKYTKLFNR